MEDKGWLPLLAFFQHFSHIDRIHVYKLQQFALIFHTMLYVKNKQNHFPRMIPIFISEVLATLDTSQMFSKASDF